MRYGRAWKSTWANTVCTSYNVFAANVPYIRTIDTSYRASQWLYSTTTNEILFPVGLCRTEVVQNGKKSSRSKTKDAARIKVDNFWSALYNLIAEAGTNRIWRPLFVFYYKIRWDYIFLISSHFAHRQQKVAVYGFLIIISFIGKDPLSIYADKNSVG